MFGVIGDSHGNVKSLRHTLGMLNASGVKTAVLCGDFGIFPSNTPAFLLETDACLAEHGMRLLVVRGNHDDPVYWEKNTNTWENITLLPRVHYFELDGFECLAVGGAVSIDKEARLYYERKYDSPGAYWFPDEQISDEDVSKVDRSADILFTHEASNYTPWGFRLKCDPDSHISRQKIDEVLRRTTPHFHFHGHYHERYAWENGTTQTFGLECDTMRDNWGIFEDGHFTFATDMPPVSDL